MMSVFKRIFLLGLLAVCWPNLLPAQDASRIAEFLQRRDENRNGQIDPEEWQASRFRQVYEAAGKDAGLDLTRPIPMEKMSQAVRTYSDKNGGNVFGGGFGGGGFGGGWGGGPPGGGFGGGFGPPGGGWGGPPPSPSSSNNNSSNSSSSSSSKPKSSSYTPGVPGFGEKIDLPPVPSFGPALDSTVALAGTPTTGDARSKDKDSRDARGDSKDSRDQRDSSNNDRKDKDKDQSREERDRRDREERERREKEENRRYAKSIVEQYDKNKDGHLAKADGEWSNLKGDPNNADYNKDGIITVDEMTERLLERARESNGGSRSSSYSKPAIGANGKPVRFLTPTERLPEGMPSWFTRADANGDAQISMGEYASKWDEQKAADFAKYDLNNDGFITASECLAAEKSRPSSSSSGSMSK